MNAQDPVELRALAPADHDHWMPLWRGYQAFYKVDIPADFTVSQGFSGIALPGKER